MAERGKLVARLFWIAVIFVTIDTLIGLMTGTAYGIADYSNNYHQFRLEDSEVCHPLGKLQTINIGRLKESALIIRQFHKFEPRRSDMKCKFKVQAPYERGLFAVIQKMSLRSHPTVNGTTECIDHIRFLSESGDSSELFCGKLENIDGKRKLFKYSSDYESEESEEEDSSEEEKTIEGFEELSKKGKIITEVFVSKQPLKRGEKLDLIVAYTPYIDCESFSKGVIGTSSNGMHKCINSKFQCDGVVNCARSECFDESDCNDSRKEKLGNVDPTTVKVTYAAMTGLLIFIVLLTLSLWTCRKYKKLCWSSDCAGPSVVDDNSVQLPMQRRDHSVSHPLPVSSAPMLEVAVSNSADKDLPPSYDSLFPPTASTTDNA